MKTLHPLSFLLICMTVFYTACSSHKNESQSEKAEVKNSVDVDSLEKAWDDAWNAGDANKIGEMLDEDAIVFENEWIVRGKDSLMKNFVIPNIAVIKKLSTTKVKDNADDNIAFRIGHYLMALKDSTKPDHEGPYTIIWKKQSDGKWKVEALHTGTDKK